MDVPDPDPDVLRVIQERIMRQIQHEQKSRLRLEETQPARGWSHYDAKFLKDLGIAPLE